MPSDKVQIAGLIISLVGTMFTGLMAYLMARLNAASRDAAVKVGEVAQHVRASNEAYGLRLDQIDATGRATHTLVNNQHGLALVAVVDAKKRILELTQSDADRKLLAEAEQLLAVHVAKQSVVDVEYTKPEQQKMQNPQGVL